MRQRNKPHDERKYESLQEFMEEFFPSTNSPMTDRRNDPEQLGEQMAKHSLAKFQPSIGKQHTGASAQAS